MELPKITRVKAVVNITNTQAKEMLHRFVLSEEQLHPFADELFTRLEQVCLSFDPSIVFQRKIKCEPEEEEEVNANVEVIQVDIKTEEPANREERKKEKAAKKEAKAAKKAAKKERKESKRKRSAEHNGESSKKAKLE